jgi:carbonic anhydrase
MNVDVLDIIRARQASQPVPEGAILPEHKPEMLLIGCVDARLDVREDVGIPQGRALIHRNIAALVRSNPDPADNEGSSVAASLEFAINVMKVKHIVVMGHTDCGGIRACLIGDHDESTENIRKYLTPLEATREDVIAHGGNIEAQARAMEEAAVRQSVKNLMSYPVVTKALKEGRIDVHGWVINTACKQISEMDLDSGKFRPMREVAQTKGAMSR